VIAETPKRPYVPAGNYRKLNKGMDTTIQKFRHCTKYCFSVWSSAILSVIISVILVLFRVFLVSADSSVVTDTLMGLIRNLNTL
jgi:hypothetical protein